MITFCFSNPIFGHKNALIVCNNIFFYWYLHTNIFSQNNRYKKIEYFKNRYNKSKSKNLPDKVLSVVPPIHFTLSLSRSRGFLQFVNLKKGLLYYRSTVNWNLWYKVVEYLDIQNTLSRESRKKSFFYWHGH